MIDDEKRLEFVLSAVELAFNMRDAGLSKTSYSRVLRETIFFVWEIRKFEKHSPLRERSQAAVGLPKNQVDYDHAIPMQIVIGKLLEAWPNREEVVNIVRNMVHGVIITKHEHAHLRQIGLNSRMPQGWDGNVWTARFDAAGIALASR
ncbi:hypothetical protein [Sedimentimonas flavescens]|uniref:hypothetical protein n=1 Tax=Sedimentimonas flavescens TaxID=2851012 RepID=UPI001C4A1AAF|nr:hypothetical protein [Sedimentimonas flavescens]MBW0159245.1 hypothetical protein [Sedimentimonas flavescens]